MPELPALFVLHPTIRLSDGTDSRVWAVLGLDESKTAVGALRHDYYVVLPSLTAPLKTRLTASSPVFGERESEGLYISEAEFDTEITNVVQRWADSVEIGKLSGKTIAALQNDARNWLSANSAVQDYHDERIVSFERITAKRVGFELGGPFPPDREVIEIVEGVQKQADEIKFEISRMSPVHDDDGVGDEITASWVEELEPLDAFLYLTSAIVLALLMIGVAERIYLAFLSAHVNRAFATALGRNGGAVRNDEIAQNDQAEPQTTARIAEILGGNANDSIEQILWDAEQQLKGAASRIPKPFRRNDVTKVVERHGKSAVIVDAKQLVTTFADVTAEQLELQNAIKEFLRAVGYKVNESDYLSPHDIVDVFNELKNRISNSPSEISAASDSQRTHPEKKEVEYQLHIDVKMDGLYHARVREFLDQVRTFCVSHLEGQNEQVGTTLELWSQFQRQMTATGIAELKSAAEDLFRGGDKGRNCNYATKLLREFRTFISPNGQPRTCLLRETDTGQPRIESAEKVVECIANTFDCTLNIRALTLKTESKTEGLDSWRKSLDSLNQWVTDVRTRLNTIPEELGRGRNGLQSIVTEYSNIQSLLGPQHDANNRQRASVRLRAAFPRLGNGDGADIVSYAKLQDERQRKLLELVNEYCRVLARNDVLPESDFEKELRDLRSEMDSPYFGLRLGLLAANRFWLEPTNPSEAETQFLQLANLDRPLRECVTSFTRGLREAKSVEDRNRLLVSMSKPNTMIDVLSRAELLYRTYCDEGSELSVYADAVSIAAATTRLALNEIGYRQLPPRLLKSKPAHMKDSPTATPAAHLRSIAMDKVSKAIGNGTKHFMVDVISFPYRDPEGRVHEGEGVPAGLIGWEI